MVVPDVNTATATYEIGSSGLRLPGINGILRNHRRPQIDFHEMIVLLLHVPKSLYQMDIGYCLRRFYSSLRIRM
ncbi:hypothetical protein L2E82_44328 [Cichorium intybus]|uniref:Uncharacterized protein n=1 Tax=Cichorium intybus TaxID=13427 RepID=A0ACB8ZQA2_CICIN|nr:hypothetical protein L2E82_44328 [Cichorium intybus]